MSCKLTEERMMDILYGDELSPELCLEFFQHLESCSRCMTEYLELVETRSILGHWDLGETISDETMGRGRNLISFSNRFAASHSWRVVQKVAAVVVVLMGITVLVQHLGWVEKRTLDVTREELAVMINDIAVSRQAQERRLVGKVMVQLRDDLEKTHRRDLGQIEEDLRFLKMHQVEVLEENSRFMRALMIR